RHRRPSVSLRPVTVLLSASGSPGTAALVRALRENGERETRLVGTDMSERAVGRHLCDSFHVVPPRDDDALAGGLLELVRRERVGVVLPQSSFDLAGLAERRDEFAPARVLVSSPTTIRDANDKAHCYDELHRLGLPAPRFERVQGGDAVAAA